MNLINSELLRLAGMALADVLGLSGPADAKLGAFFRNNRELGNKERAFVAESVWRSAAQKFSGLSNGWKTRANCCLPGCCVYRA